MLRPAPSPYPLGDLLSWRGEEPPHRTPTLSDHAIVSLAAGDGAAWIRERPPGLLCLVPYGESGGLVEAAGEEQVELWETGSPPLFAEAASRRMTRLGLLAPSPSLQSWARDQGLVAERMVLRGRRGRSEAPGARWRPGVERYLPSRDGDSLVRLLAMAMAGHAEAPGWTGRHLPIRMSLPGLGPGRILVVRGAGGALTGCCWTRLHRDGAGEVYLVAVRPGSRRRGMGGDLLESGIADLEAEGGEETIAHWDHGNEGAERLYRRWGFTVEAAIPVFALVG